MLVWKTHVECKSCGVDMSAREYFGISEDERPKPAPRESRPATDDPLQRQPRVPSDEPLPDALVRSHELAITPFAREYLNSRGLTPSVCQRWHIGYDERRDAITIPVIEGGQVVDIRLRYLSNPNCKYGHWTERDGERVLSWGEPRLFNRDALDDVTEAIYVEGEADCVLTQEITGMTCVTSTSGVRTFRREWAEAFRRCQVVYVVPDLDLPGLQGMMRAASMIGLRRCYMVALPEDLGRSGDLTDYWASGAKRFDFIQLMAGATRMDLLKPGDGVCQRYV